MQESQNDKKKPQSMLLKVGVPICQGGNFYIQNEEKGWRWDFFSLLGKSLLLRIEEYQ